MRFINKFHFIELLPVKSCITASTQNNTPRQEIKKRFSVSKIASFMPRKGDKKNFKEVLCYPLKNIRARGIENEYKYYPNNKCILVYRFKEFLSFSIKSQVF